MMGCRRETREDDVKTLKAKSQTIPSHDYRSALQGALSWLGDRYLLAEPLNRRNHANKSPPSKPRPHG